MTTAQTSAEHAVGARVARVLRGTLALSLDTAVSVLTPIIIVPVALSTWGAAKYGEWVALTGLASFLRVSDLGLQTYVVNRMAGHFARGENDELLSDLHSALRVQAPLVGGVWLLAAVVACVAPVNKWLAVHTASHLDTSIALLFIAAELLIWVPMGTIAGTYRATERLPRAAIIGLVQRAALALVPLALIASRKSFTTVALSRALIVCVATCWVVRDLARCHPWFSLRPLRGSVARGREMLGPAFLFLLAALSDYAVSQGSTMVAQAVLGGAAVSTLATHRTVANLGRTAPTVLSTAVWPEMTMMHARGDLPVLRRALRSTAKINAWIVGLLFLAFLPVSELVYRAWTMRALAFDGVLLGLLVLQTVLWSTWYGAYTLLAATNRQGRLLLVLVASATVNLTLSVLLVPRLGVRGAAVASLVGEMLVSTWLGPLIACRSVGDSFLSYAREIAGSLLLGLGVPAAAAAGLWLVLPTPWARTVLVPLVGCMLSIVLMWPTLVDSERQVVRRVLLRLRLRLRLKYH